jgi:branched-chain amino acid transport system permease protein
VASWIDYTINGLIIGNIYALLAVGLALIFGVSRLINFAHGSVYLVGAYAGLVAETWFGLPLPVTFVLVIVVGALLGLLIERFGLRPLQGYAHIAPLLATIGISFVLDQLVQIFFSPDPRALPSDLLDKRYPLGSGTIGALDLVIAAVGLTSAALLYYFLRFTKLGWAVRATAQDRDAAQQMGVDVNAVNRTVFAIASGLGAVSGLLVGMYYNYIDTAMSFQATLKGVVAQVVGGVGNVPGAIAGSLLLGVVESYGIALFGTSYRNLFAFVLLVLVLVLRPNGLFASARQNPPEPMTGTFIAPSKPFVISPRILIGIAVVLAVLPAVYPDPYIMQTFSNAWLYGMLGLSLTLIAGTVGMISLGHAALLAIGGYASALLALNFGIPVGFTILLAGVITAALGTLLVFPSFRLRGHYFSIATLAVGEIVSLVILNWEGLTRGPIGLSAIPPLSLFGVELESAESVYWFTFAVLVVLVLLQFRLLGSHLGRVLRAVRDDDVAARSYGIRLERYKALAFAFGSFAAGISGGITAHLYSYINHETFTAQLSILALTIVILGGMGNVIGAIVGSVLLVGLAEALRVVSGVHIGAYEVPDLRILIYGIILLLLVRFRPQGLFGTV